MAQRNQSKFVTERVVDDPLIIGPGYRFDDGERRYIDNQVRGVQQFLTDEVIAIPDDSGAGDLFYFNGTDMVRVPAGTEGQVLTMVGGVPAWSSGVVFDPSVLNLAVWQRDFGGAPWAGTASAGASGSHSFVVGTAPGVGASLNGHASADFDGTNDVLVLSGLQMVDAISTTAYRIALLFEADTLPAPAGSIFANPGIFADGGGNFGVVVNSAGIHVYHHDGAYKVASGPAALSTATKYAIDIVYDGANITVSVNGVAGTPVAAGTLGGIVTECRLGESYSGFGDLRIWDFMSAQATLAASMTTAQHKGYINARFGLSL